MGTQLPIGTDIITLIQISTVIEAMVDKYSGLGGEAWDGEA